MVSFVILLVARTARIVWRTDRQRDRQTENDKPSTVTLAAHARRGLIIVSIDSNYNENALFFAIIIYNYV